MSTSADYIKFVCDQIKDFGDIRYKKMFGEYMVYINNKPILWFVIIQFLLKN